MRYLTRLDVERDATREAITLVDRVDVEMLSSSKPVWRFDTDVDCPLLAGQQVQFTRLERYRPAAWDRVRLALVSRFPIAIRLTAGYEFRDLIGIHFVPKRVFLG